MILTCILNRMYSILLVSWKTEKLTRIYWVLFRWPSDLEDGNWASQHLRPRALLIRLTIGFAPVVILATLLSSLQSPPSYKSSTFHWIQTSMKMMYRWLQDWSRMSSCYHSCYVTSKLRLWQGPNVGSVCPETTIRSCRAVNSKSKWIRCIRVSFRAFYSTSCAHFRLIQN